MDTPPSRPPRRYTPAEVDEVFRRAGEVELARAAGDLSLADLEAIGAEVGLDPVAVRRAAGAVALPSPAASDSRLAGGATRLHAALTFPAPLTPERRARAVDALRALAGVDGASAPGAGGPGLDWLVVRRAGTLRVALAPRDGATDARLDASLGEHALAVHLALLAGGAVAGALVAVVVWSVAAALAPAAVAALATVGAAHLVARRLVARRARAAGGELAAAAAALADVLGPPDRASG